MTLAASILGRVAFYGLILVLVVAYLRYFEWKNIYYPSHVIEATPGDQRLEYEDVSFVAEDGCQLRGWWIPHEAARGTIIVCNGNAGNMGDRTWIAADLLRLGVNVFLFDYRGYGESRGIPTEQGTYRDARAAYEVVRVRYNDVEQPPIIAYGQSLGGAVAVQLALDKPLRGLILESTFTSVPDLGKVIYPWLPVNLISRWRYESARKVPRITVPKLCAHSRGDELIPFEIGRRLYDLAAEPKEFVALSGGHNEAGWDVTAEYWRAIERFAECVLGPRPPETPATPPAGASR